MHQRTPYQAFKFQIQNVSFQVSNYRDQAGNVDYYKFASSTNEYETFMKHEASFKHRCGSVRVPVCLQHPMHLHTKNTVDLHVSSCGGGVRLALLHTQGCVACLLDVCEHSRPGCMVCGWFVIR